MSKAGGATGNKLHTEPDHNMEIKRENSEPFGEAVENGPPQELSYQLNNYPLCPHWQNTVQIRNCTILWLFRNITFYIPIWSPKWIRLMTKNSLKLAKEVEFKQQHTRRYGLKDFLNPLRGGTSALKIRSFAVENESTFITMRWRTKTAKCR